MLLQINHRLCVKANEDEHFAFSFVRIRSSLFTQYIVVRLRIPGSPADRRHNPRERIGEFSPMDGVCRDTACLCTFHMAWCLNS